VHVEPVRYADSESGQIAFQVIGQGPPDLVYVPALVNHIEALWDIPEMARHVEALASFCRLIVLDKRGSGLSDPLPAGRVATVEERMEDITAVLDVVGADRPWFFATADGVAVAVVHAATHPERVAGLVVYAGSARALVADDMPFGLPERLVPRTLEWVRSSWGNDDDAGLDALAPSMAGERRWRAALARIERRACTPATAVRHWQTVYATDIRHVLPMLSVPTLVLQVTGDHVVPVEHGRYLARHIPAATYVELAGTDHLYFAENAEQIEDHIERFVTGRSDRSSASRTLATVLFTDIVDSTRHSAELGDRRWRVRLDAHDIAATTQVIRYGGTVVKSTGDGLLAIFDAPGRAIRAALAIRTDAGAMDLEIRAGLHSGEIERRGGDVAGLAVHVAARVNALARAGEILVSRTVRDLVAGSGAQFVDRGTHHLKGVPEPWTVYALRTEGPGAGPTAR
jgi:class 3 adenylate cyclase